MSGDLGNLLTGELGEAEARFSHEDFAADFGQRIAGRVRRRRAVRAAGVGGGTMLTAGALVLGAAHMPWGVLGAAPGMGGSDCATPWPSLGAPSYSVVIDTDQGSLTNLTIMEAATGAMIVGGVQQADGTYLFTDGYGEPLTAVQGSAGLYTVALPSGVTSLESTSTDAYRSAAVSTSYLNVHAPTLVIDDGGAERQARGECYTPSPTPSPDPSLAAEFRYVVGDSPFQCGFPFPTESGGADGLAVTARTVSADEIRAEFAGRFGNQSPTTDGGAGAAVWATATGMPTSTGDVVATLSASDPAAGSGTLIAGTDSRGPGTYRLLPGGMSFVGARDGVVVATVVPGYDGATPGMVLDRVGVEADPDGFLLDRSALTACTSTVGSLDSLDLYAVAGYDKNLGLVYAWTEVSAP